jgi:hypothetical protein
MSKTDHRPSYGGADGLGIVFQLTPSDTPAISCETPPARAAVKSSMRLVAPPGLYTGGADAIDAITNPSTTPSSS